MESLSHKAFLAYNHDSESGFLRAKAACFIWVEQLAVSDGFSFAYAQRLFLEDLTKILATTEKNRLLAVVNCCMQQLWKSKSEELRQRFMSYKPSLTLKILQINCRKTFYLHDTLLFSYAIAITRRFCAHGFY